MTYLSVLTSGGTPPWVRQRECTITHRNDPDYVGRGTTAINVTTYGIGGATGVFAVSKSIEHDEFRDYVISRDLSREFTCI
jgi:hypothetical protein